MELLTPVPKKEHLQEIYDTPKITGLSDFGKTFKGFLKSEIQESEILLNTNSQ